MGESLFKPLSGLLILELPGPQSPPQEPLLPAITRYLNLSTHNHIFRQFVFHQSSQHLNKTIRPYLDTTYMVKSSDEILADLNS